MADLLCIHIESRNLIILDPLGQVDVNSILFKNGVFISGRILRQIFNCHIERVTQLDNVGKQQDALVQLCTDKFRREIYESILNYSK